MGIEIGPSQQQFVLIFFRILAVIWLAPIFTARAVSMYFKAAFSFVMAFLIFELLPVPGSAATDPFMIMIMIAREILIGVAIGFSVRLLFSAISAAGDLIALQSGFGFARFMDPFTMTQVSPLEQAKNLLAMMIFFALDGHLILVRGLAVSFRDLPLGGGVIREPLITHFIAGTARIFDIGLRLGAPIIVTLFLVELSLGILSRMIPQVNIFVEGLPLKILVTLMVFSLSLGVMVPFMANVFKGLDGELFRIFRYMA
jgi:flagellar biosynthetic protein FliR